MRLPDFPWDHLAEAKARASAVPGGLVDLSVGTPVDPTPEFIQRALAQAADAPAYPLTHGTPQLRQSIADWERRVLGVEVDPANVLPVIGTKELVAWLPTLMGLGPGDTVVYPEVAYPTYDIGARIAGCQTSFAGPAALTWLNTPSNPTGRVMSVPELRQVVGDARSRGQVVVSDECYIELAWDAQPVSVLHPDVVGDDHTGVLSVYSLSKRSNLAGYRFGFVTGDPSLIAQLLAVRKHAGMMVPAPVQAAATAAFADDEHVAVQKQRYRDRRAALWPALLSAGFRIDDSQAGLYLWATRDEPCWDSVNWLADRGILVAPGEFYGTAGARHVRVALTATDEAVESASERLSRA